MQVDLSPLKRKNFQGSLPFEGTWQPEPDVFKNEGLLFDQPVQLRGRLWKERDCLQAEIELSARGRMRCDRCNNWYAYRPDMTYEARYCPDESEADSESSLDEGVYYGRWNPKENQLDLLPGIIEQLILSLPTKKLCRDDCQGLCPSCGTNLNEDRCQCERQSVDPRLAELSQWLRRSE